VATPDDQVIEQDKPDPKMDRSRDVSRLSRHSYLAGLAGVVTVMGMGYLGARRGVFKAVEGGASGVVHGWRVLGGGDADMNLSMAFVLLVCSAVMFAVELAIRFDVDRGKLIKLSPLLEEGRHASFLLECVQVYLAELALLFVILGFYRTAGEYGFRNNGQGYYKPWFAVMNTFFSIYLYGGMPYVLLTRALQYAPRSDRRQAAFTVIKTVRRLVARLRRVDQETLEALPALDRYDKSALLGLLVKLFFVPLMTVFFGDQFSHLVKNYEWMLGDGFKLSNVNLRDVHNVSHSVIFAIDVGLAWCGYVVSSRWIKNTLFSTEPTWEGWTVALLCYPPINRTLGVYYSAPPEDAFFAIPNPTVVAFFAILSILSFTVYTSATVMFGLRFSNLTHRGIITTGPYALVRHPAYASKNFSWWCVMLPYALYEIYLGRPWATRDWSSCLPVLGMMIMSGIYYRRALTEEQHLSRDAEYRIYMKKVPYRFIPGVL